MAERKRKLKVLAKKIGKFYSNVILQNIALFIAYGLLNVLFGQNGWFPHEGMQQLSSLFYYVILPAVIAKTAGTYTGDREGGLAALLACIGFMGDGQGGQILASLCIAPIAGFLMKKVWELGKDRVASGFEMLIKNLFIGIFGTVLAGISYFLFRPFMGSIHRGLLWGINGLFEHHLVPLMAVFIEPAKVFFLNNTINHGLLVPLGMEQVEEAGKSVLFLLETNPGPGLGILAAMAFYDKRHRKNLGACMAVESLGGIHELYFPNVLANPKWMISVILGGIAGNFWFISTGAGIAGPASPGSIITLLLMAPKQSWIGILSGVFISALVSGMSALIIMRNGVQLSTVPAYHEEANREERKNREAEHKEKETDGGTKIGLETEEEGRSGMLNVYFVCDGGFGSSAMGAAILRRKLKASHITSVTVSNCAADCIPEGVDTIFCHEGLRECVENSGTKAKLYYVDDLMNTEEYDKWIETLRQNN